MNDYKLVAAAAFALLTACAAVVPAELRDARLAYDTASRGPAAKLTPAELHKAHQALLAAEAAWKDDPQGFHTLDLAYVAQRKAEIAEGRAGIASEEKAKQQAQADLAATQARLVEQTKAELARTKGDLTRSTTDLRAIQANAAVVAGQLTTEQRAHQEADRRAAESQATAANVAGQLTTEQHARQEADRRAAVAQASLARLAAVKEEARGLVADSVRGCGASTHAVIFGGRGATAASNTLRHLLAPWLGVSGASACGATAALVCPFAGCGRTFGDAVALHAHARMHPDGERAALSVTASGGAASARARRRAPP